MKRHGNLYQQIISRENIILAERKARRGKGFRKSVQKFESDIDNNINLIQEMLANYSYWPSKYKIKTIYEPKKREIYIAPFIPDRIVHHALMNVLEPIWSGIFISDSYASRCGYGLHAGSRKTMQYIRQSGRNAYCLKMDISKFYPSMRHDILFRIIQKKIKCKDTLELTRRIIYSIDGGRNVPIGNYTSQWFGNLYLNELDYYFKHILKVKHYIRYCDDFIVLHKNKKYLNELRIKIREFLNANLDLKFSKAEIFPIKNGIDFLGYRHFYNYVLIRKSTSKRLKRRLRIVTRWFLDRRYPREKYCSVLASIAGWLGYANSHNLKHKLNIDYYRGLLNA